MLGGAVARYDATADALTAPAARSDVLVLDWAGTPDAADAVARAGTKLADYLRTLLPAEGRLDLHFIGHGTGSYVALAAVPALAADDGKVGRLQVTSLNPLAPPGAEPPLPRAAAAGAGPDAGAAADRSPGRRPRPAARASFTPSRRGPGRRPRNRR